MRICFLAQDRNFYGGINRSSGFAARRIESKIGSDNVFSIDADKYYNLGIKNQVKFIRNDEILNNYAANVYGFDIFHSFYYPIKKSKKANYSIVLSVHDLRSLDHPEWDPNPGAGYGFYGEILKEGALAADKIVTVSEFSKETIVKYYGVSPDKISVVYHGRDVLSEKNTYIESENSVSEYIGLGDDFVFSALSTPDYPHKNVKRLIRAFYAYKERRKDDLKLVITGSPDNSETWKHVIYDNPAFSEDVIFAGYVDSAVLDWFYKNCLAVVFPSLYEGFGMPLLEAMGYGKACISSNVTSLPEVGGDAVEYCDPYSEESISDAIDKVINNESYRKELGEKAYRRASLFSYDKEADEFLKIYTELLGDRI